MRVFAPVAALAISLQLNVLAHPPTIEVFPSLDDATEEIKDLVEVCEGFDKPGFEPNNSCAEKLDSYFMSGPIWDDSIAFNLRTHISPSAVEYSLLSPRYLRYGRIDRVMDSLPRWRDVFDGKLIERIDVVEKIFQRPECSDLRDSERIAPELFEICQARELFKYSAYLDGCLTSLDRARRWIGLLDQSFYQSAVQSIREEFESIKHRARASLDDIVEQFTRSTLRTAWMVHQCKTLVLPEFDQDLNLVSPARANLPKRIRFGLDNVVKVGHDAALQIAAMAGDEWAIHRYWPTRDSERLKFWKALLDFKPLVAHGYLARFFKQFELTYEDAVLHTAKAYSLIRQSDAQFGLGLEEFVANEFSQRRATRLIEILWEEGLDESTVFDDEKLLESKLKYPW